MRLVVIVICLALVAACDGDSQNDDVTASVRQSNSSDLDNSKAFPITFNQDVSDTDLRSVYGLSSIASMKHPEYEDDIKCAIQRINNHGFTDYKIAFYALNTDQYSIIDKPLQIGGYEQPTFGTLPETSYPCVVAQMQYVGDKSYFYILGAKLASSTENEHKWTRIKEQGQELDVSHPAAKPLLDLDGN